MSSKRRPMAVDCISPNQFNASFAFRSPLPSAAEAKLRRRMKAAFENPLTFVFLVWAAMFAMTIVFLNVLD